MDIVRECKAARDPRIRRTRHALQEALRKLLERKGFEQISVLEISELASVNRATFYDHFSDKFALLESLVASTFFGLLEGRHIHFDGTCPSAIRALILAVCDFLTDDALGAMAPDGSFQPLVESSVISLIRRVLLQGAGKIARNRDVTAELIATTAGWAIFGAVKEWAATPDRAPSDTISTIILELVAPILGFPAWEGAKIPEESSCLLELTEGP